IVAAVAGGAVWLVFLAREAMALLQFAIMAVVIKRMLPGYRPRPWSFSRKMFRRIFGLSRWALISGIAGLLIYQTDKIIIGALIPAVGALTVYAIIAKPFELIKIASGLFNSAVMPAVSAATEKEGRAGADRFIYTGARLNNA